MESRRVIQSGRFERRSTRNDQHPSMESRAICALGEQSTGDVTVKILTEDDRDYRFRCHSHILSEESVLFANRLSDNPATIELRCIGSDLDHLVNFLRSLYISDEDLIESACTSFRNAIGVLRIAEEYGCRKLVSACVSYLEAVPWGEEEEAEILKVIPGMGEMAESLLARVQPVGESAVRRMFLSAAKFAMSSPCLEKADLKASAQEQLEYMLEKDDDAPMLLADEEMKKEVKRYWMEMFERFRGVLKCAPKDDFSVLTLLSDLLWTFQILARMKSAKDFVSCWVDSSEEVIKRVDFDGQERGKAIEITSKVLNSMAYGSVVLPAAERIRVVTKWLPLVRGARVSVVVAAIDDEVWQAMEAAFVMIVLTLPSEEQAEILREWIESENSTYPDLTVAFEIWCYRTKIAKGRLGL